MKLLFDKLKAENYQFIIDLAHCKEKTEITKFIYDFFILYLF